MRVRKEPLMEAGMDSLSAAHLRLLQALRVDMAHGQVHVAVPCVRLAVFLYMCLHTYTEDDRYVTDLGIPKLVRRDECHMQLSPSGVALHILAPRLSSSATACPMNCKGSSCPTH